MKPKNYKIWHNTKYWIHNDKQRPRFRESEVWFCSLGENIGFEEDGKGRNFLRPVIIVRKFNKQVLWALAITSKQKVGKYYFPVDFGRGINTAILSQLRLIDSKRLMNIIGTIPKGQFSQLTKKLKELIP
jgi:mRNA interferase MazF